MSAKNSAGPSEDRDPIDLLADSFVARFRSGERPSIDQWIVAATGLGLLLTPKLSVGGPAITIDASQGATAAMDAGGQPVVDMADPVNPQDAVTRIFVTDQVGAVLPTSDPAEAGALWVDGAAGFVIKVSQG